MAVGRGDLAEAVDGPDLTATVPLHTVYADLLRWYYVVGGMPEAVATYVDSGDVRDVRRIHGQLLEAYERDFSKHAPAAQVPRLREVFTSLPARSAPVRQLTPQVTVTRPDRSTSTARASGR